MKKLLILSILLFPTNLYSKEYQNFYNVKYIDNYDGDTATFEIKVFKKGKTEIIIMDDVRIKNLNAEEIRNKDKEKKKVALKQKEKLRQKLQNAKQIDLLKCEREKYGRLLCEFKIKNN